MSGSIIPIIGGSFRVLSDSEGYHFLDRYLADKAGEEFAKEFKGKIALTLKL